MIDRQVNLNQIQANIHSSLFKIDFFYQSDSFVVTIFYSPGGFVIDLKKLLTTIFFTSALVCGEKNAR